MKNAWGRLYVNHDVLEEGSTVLRRTIDGLAKRKLRCDDLLRLKTGIGVEQCA
jgi:hypothetical protein